ncbi:MAG TPA: MATE family efflux transporter [Pirellulaceae bacterium]|nr:MATE family efflux transporter [Pirellulaceae bacterium]
MSADGARQGWWSGEAGVRELLGSALPLAVSTSTFALMYFCDRMFLAWYDTLDMAAVMQAGTFSWTASAFFFGLASYAIAFVSQYRGSGRPDRIGAVVWHTAYVALLSLPCFLLIATLADDLFVWFGHAPELIDRQASYIRIMAVGMPGQVLAAGLNAFFVGLDRTRIVMLIDVAASLVNIVLDYLWIFGIPGIAGTEWGLEGAAWATVVAIWFKVVCYLLLMRLQTDRATFAFASSWRFDPDLAWRMIRYGGPNGLQFTLEGSTFAVILLFLGRLEPLAMEATTLAISVNLVAFVPMIGIAMAVTGAVGNQIGRGRADLATRATWSGMAIGTFYSGLFAFAYWFLPEKFLIFHQLDPVEDARLIGWSIFLLKFVAAYCLFDAWQLIFASAIKGAGDTLFTVWTLVATTVIVVVCGAAIEPLFETFDGKLLWWWSCLTGWLMMLCVAFGGRFFQGRWRTMSVVETHAIETPTAGDAIASRPVSRAVEASRRPRRSR